MVDARLNFPARKAATAAADSTAHEVEPSFATPSTTNNSTEGGSAVDPDSKPAATTATQPYWRSAIDLLAGKATTIHLFSMPSEN